MVSNTIMAWYRQLIDTILEINGEHMPKPLKAMLKLSGNLETMIDWAEKSERWGLFR